jgi:hypothetical protein
LPAELSDVLDGGRTVKSAPTEITDPIFAAIDLHKGLKAQFVAAADVHWKLYDAAKESAACQEA